MLTHARAHKHLQLSLPTAAACCLLPDHARLHQDCQRAAIDAADAAHALPRSHQHPGRVARLAPAPEVGASVAGTPGAAGTPARNTGAAAGAQEAAAACSCMHLARARTLCAVAFGAHTVLSCGCCCAWPRLGAARRLAHSCSSCVWRRRSLRRSCHSCARVRPGCSCLLLPSRRSRSSACSWRSRRRPRWCCRPRAGVGRLAGRRRASLLASHASRCEGNEPAQLLAPGCSK